MRAEEINRRQADAETVASVQLHYARQGRGLAGAALAGASACVQYRHYPAKDVSDAAANTRFYYHAHPSSRYPREEHGHFHLFRYGSAEGDDFQHIAGLSLDALGRPLRWFATNRWVTGERWRPAAEVAAGLADFRIETRGRLAPVARWLGALVRLYADDIAALLAERDRALAPHIARDGEATAFEDRRLDVLAEAPIDLPARLLQLAA